MKRLLGLLLAARLCGAPAFAAAPAEGARGVVAAGHRLSAEAGLRILKQGGNAVDAGCAALLAAAVVEFNAFALGGEAPILLRPAGGEPVAIGGYGPAPRLTEPERLSRGGVKREKLSTVPGAFDGIVTALQRHGTMTLAQVMRPAVELADGFVLDADQARVLRGLRKSIEKWPSTARVFLPGGRPPAARRTLSQPDLARTLRRLIEAEARASAAGREAGLMAARDYFYNGPVAREVGKASEDAGGWLRAEDFAAYRASVEPAVSADYRGYRVYKPGYWTQGPAFLEALNVLEGFDVHGLGHNTPAYVHLVVEAVKAAMADRDAHYADPAFAEVPADRLLSEERAAELRARIDPARAATEAPAVRPGGPPPPDDASGTDTTSVNAADRWGNVFSATPSGGFGPMAGDTGLMFGVRMLSFSRQAGHPNAPAPGKRPRTTLSPTLVAAPDGSFWALSSPGGDLQDQALLQVFLNRVEFGMDPQAAVEAPRFWSFHHVNSFGKTEFKAGALGLEKPLRAKAGKALARLGHRLEDGGSDWAAPTLVELLPGRLTGGADPRLGAKAEAW